MKVDVEIDVMFGFVFDSGDGYLGELCDDMNQV